METMRKVIARLPHRDPLSRGDLTHDLSITQAGPFLRELEAIYGTSGGRGLALRIGRATFRYGLKHFGEQAGFRATEFRLLPAPRRLENGLRALARIIAKEWGGEIQVSDEGAHWLWRMEPGRSIAGSSSQGASCFLIAGLLQEFTAWAGGGRFYRVVETECLASGSPACLYRIEKRPLD